MCAYWLMQESLCDIDMHKRWPPAHAIRSEQVSGSTIPDAFAFALKHGSTIEVLANGQEGRVEFLIMEDPAACSR